MNDITRYNRLAWDHLVESKNQWTRPVSTEAIKAARRGDWQIVLTPSLPVPGEWLGDVAGRDVLCLAGGGGQQGPLLAAAGARVTVFDNSPGQLGQDRLVADRDGLQLTTMLGDMRSLNGLADESFDVVVNPCSAGFIPDVLPVWREVARVLRKGGRLMCGLINPLYFLFDEQQMQAGKLIVNQAIPWSDERDLPANSLQQLKLARQPLMFGHTMEDQIGGQLAVGLQLIGFYEDGWQEGAGAMLDGYIKTFFATLAEKPDDDG
jgi:SAM-dependent methyltransferase